MYFQHLCISIVISMHWCHPNPNQKFKLFFLIKITRKQINNVIKSKLNINTTQWSWGTISFCNNVAIIITITTAGHVTRAETPGSTARTTRRFCWWNMKMHSNIFSAFMYFSSYIHALVDAPVNPHLLLVKHENAFKNIFIISVFQLLYPCTDDARIIS